MPDDNCTLPLQILRNKTNQGRSVARNRGASAGCGHAIIFLDVDLCLSGASAFQTLLDRLEATGGLVIGSVHRHRPKFWAWYGNRTIGQRLSRSGPCWADTTAFMALRRPIFDRLHGFDEAFREYGFEDRDLIYRAYYAGIPIARCRDAEAEHSGDVHAARIAEKLYEAGRTTAQRFRSKHPDAYRELPYSRIDISEAPSAVRWSARLLYSGASRIARLGARFEDRNRLPFPARAAAVRVLFALAFAAGTARCESSNKRPNSSEDA